MLDGREPGDWNRAGERGEARPLRAGPLEPGCLVVRV